MRKYKIPEQYGGDTEENTQRLEERIKELQNTNGHLELDHLERIAMGDLFSGDRDKRAGGS